MVKAQPDKWVRKAVFDAINNIVVDTLTIPCYDTFVTRDVNSNMPDHYVLMTTQTNDVDDDNKCEDFWNSSILIDIVTYYPLPGNPGSRLLADNILEAVKNAVNNLALDGASGLEIFGQTMSNPPDITTTTEKENVFRKLLRLELEIR